MLRTSLSSSTTFTPSNRYYQDYQKKNIPQTKPTLLIKINTALASLVKLVMMSHVSRSYLVSKHLCEAEHISTQLNCSSARDHAISFMLFPLKSHLALLYYFDCPIVGFLWSCSEKVGLPQGLPLFCLFSYLLSHRKVSSWSQSLPVHSLKSCASAHSTVARKTSLSKSPVLQNIVTFILSDRTCHQP